jgi:ATP adenylyltransferase
MQGAIFERRIHDLKNRIYSVVDNSKSIEYFTKHDSITIEDPEIKGLAVQIIQAENLSKKEAVKFKKEDPFLPPFEPGLFVCDLTDHRILVNKFSMVKYHVLITTKLFEDQHSLLHVKDFIASYLALKALKGFCFYNGGPTSGSSQPHRHLQALPMHKEIPQSVLMQIELEMNEVQKDPVLGFKVHNLSFFRKYRHYIVELPVYDPDQSALSVEEFTAVYYDRYIKLLELLDNRDHHFSYNLVWTERWMFMVLRSKEHLLDKYSVNCLGIIGSFLVKNLKEKEELAALTPTQLYDEIFVML